MPVRPARAGRRGAVVVALVVGLVVATALTGCQGFTPRKSDLPDQKLTARIEAAIARQLASGGASGAQYQLLRGIYVSLGGRTLLERYFDSSPDDYHDVDAVTQGAVMSTLVGIAIGEGRLRLDDPLRKLLPAYAGSMTADVGGRTLSQILTMTAGFSDAFYGKVPEFSLAPDWTSRVLQTPAGAADGRFLFSDGGAHLLSAILIRATGQSVLDYARARLFDPLGIVTRPSAQPVDRPTRLGTDDIDATSGTGFTWPVDAQGNEAGWGRLRLRLSDLVKLGTLYLNQGRWGGRQVVPAAWVRAATLPQVSSGGLGNAFGYLWWIRTADGYSAYAAAGFGGQLIEVVPDLGLVVAMSTEFSLTDPVNQGVDTVLLMAMVESFITPAVRGPV